MPSDRQREPRAHGRGREDAALSIEGIHGVEEALDAGLPLRRAYVSRDERDEVIAGVLARLEEAGVPTKTVDRATLDARSTHGAHQGIIVEMAPFAYTSVESIAAPSSEDVPRLVVAADHITDAGNLGTLIRSAEAAGAQGLIIPNRRSAAVSAATFKASAGAAAHLPIAQTPNIAQALDRLKDAGFWVFGASEHAEDVIWNADLRGDVALVVGNEATGLSDLVARRCDRLVKLPMRGRVSSLNVAQAATACCFEWLRQNLSEKAR